MGKLISKRQIAEAMAAFDDRGCPVKGARLSTDGSITLLTDIPADALAVPDGDWIDLAGASEIHRA